jgi:hypothetical protein
MRGCHRGSAPVRGLAGVVTAIVRGGPVLVDAVFVRRPTPARGIANMADRKGQVALVTGASRGVGRGVAVGLAHA